MLQLATARGWYRWARLQTDGQLSSDTPAPSHYMYILAVSVQHRARTRKWAHPQLRVDAFWLSDLCTKP